MVRVSARFNRAESPSGEAEKDGTPEQPDPEVSATWRILEGCAQKHIKILFNRAAQNFISLQGAFQQISFPNGTYPRRRSRKYEISFLQSKIGR